MSTVVAVQPQINLPYPDASTFDAGAIDSNVAAGIAYVERACGELGADIVAFPEFFLTGYTLGVDVDGWIRASIKISGPEIERLSEVAQREKVYVTGAAYEIIDDFPGRFFNTAFLIAPNGELILTYRKLYAMTTKTRPLDVLDQWLDKFGPDSLFPVADTPIGRIGMMIARDAHWPEMARSLAMRGAEIFINPNAANAEPSDAGIYVRRSRAYENHCYLVSANIGPFIAAGEEQVGQSRAPTEIIDYRGRVLSRKENSCELMVSAEIDIEALRRFRAGESDKGNFLAQLQPQLHAPHYQDADFFPSNAWADTPLQSNAENKSVEKEVIRKMINRGIIVAPKGVGE